MRQLCAWGLSLLLVLAPAATATAGKKPPVPPTPTLQFSWIYTILDDYNYYMDPSPAIGDLDNDGQLESVFGTGDYYQTVCDEFNVCTNQNVARYVALDAAGSWLWDGFTLSDEAQASPSIVDLDWDNVSDVVGGCTSGQWALAYDGPSGAMKWRYGGRICTGVDEYGNPINCDSYGEYKASPAAADVRSDHPGLEVIAVDWNHHVTCLKGYRGYGEVENVVEQRIWEYHDPDDHRFIASPAIGDVDNDRALEAIAISESGRVFCFDAATGAVEWTYDLGEPFPSDYFEFGYNDYERGVVVSSPALANLDRDKALEITFGSFGGKLYCLDGATGAPQWVYAGCGPISSSPAVGDVDEDGKPEIVFGSADTYVYALGASGALEWRFKTGGRVNSSPALAKRSSVVPFASEWPMFRHDPARTGYYGPGPTRLGVYIGSDDGYLYLLDGKGGTLKDKFLTATNTYQKWVFDGTDWVYQIFDATGSIHSSPAVADMDGDGKLDVLFKQEGMRLYGLEDLGL